MKNNLLFILVTFAVHLFAQQKTIIQIDNPHKQELSFFTLLNQDSIFATSSSDSFTFENKDYFQTILVINHSNMSFNTIFLNKDKVQIYFNTTKRIQFKNNNQNASYQKFSNSLDSLKSLKVNSSIRNKFIYEFMYSQPNLLVSLEYVKNSLRYNLHSKDSIRMLYNKLNPKLYNFKINEDINLLFSNNKYVVVHKSTIEEPIATITSKTTELSNIFYDTIFYKSNQFLLENQYKEKIEKRLDNEILEIVLYGYTDTIGNEKSNLVLSKKRIFDVSKYIHSINDTINITEYSQGEKTYNKLNKNNQNRCVIIKYKTVVDSFSFIFKHLSISISPSSRNVLLNILETIKNKTNYTLLIKAYNCGHEKNIDIQRALLIKKYLMKKTIKESQILIKNMGTDTRFQGEEKYHKYARRVEIIITYY